VRLAHGYRSAGGIVGYAVNPTFAFDGVTDYIIKRILLESLMLVVLLVIMKILQVKHLIY
jgi:hypothetical protein